MKNLGEDKLFNKIIKKAAILMILTIIALPSLASTVVLADDDENLISSNDMLSTVISANSSKDYSIQYEDGEPVIVVYENSNRLLRANVYKWGAWSYTHIAVSTGVLAGAINAALYSGVGVVASTVGLPALVITGLLNAVGWTKLGSAPGVAVAKKWDTSKNGWVGFYVSKGYDGAGRVVATRYQTR